MQVELHPEAQAETRRAAIWYDERQLGVGDRFLAAVTGSLSEPLIGQIVLEGLDLIADCANRTLTPRTPDYPSLKLK